MHFKINIKYLVSKIGGKPDKIQEMLDKQGGIPYNNIMLTL